MDNNADIIEIKKTGEPRMEYDKEKQAFAVTVPLEYKTYLKLDIFKEPGKGLVVTIG